MAKVAYRVRNWKKYNKALVQRGSITFWINEKIARKWYQPESRDMEQGRPKTYSDTAIEACLVLRSLFKQPLRATQGLVESLFKMIGLKIKVPCYTQLSRRLKNLNLRLQHRLNGKIHVVLDATGLKIFGEGEWKVRMHGYTKRRKWRKLHVGIDVKTQQIVMMEITENQISDNKTLSSLLAQYSGGYTRIGGDKAYDSYGCHELVKAYDAISAINLQETAKERRKPHDNEEPLVRDEIIRRIAEIGKEQWKIESQYHLRSLVETTMFRYKTILGNKMHSRSIENQKVEALIGCNILNLFARIGMPESYAVR